MKAFLPFYDENRQGEEEKTDETNYEWISRNEQLMSRHEFYILIHI